MKKLLTLILTMVFTSSSIPSFADQVWGDAVEVLGSNHDQFIELSVAEGQTWTTNLNVYIKESGQAVVFPVTGTVIYNQQLQVSKNTWVVNSYTSPDSVIASKTEATAGTYNYDVIFQANTDLEALSKTFDKISIRVVVLAPEVPVDTTPPVVTAPDDITLEATDILTPVDLGTALVDDSTATLTNNSPQAFPIGTTMVQWQASDPSGNIGSDEQSVTIVDTTAPVFTELPVSKTVIYSGTTTLVDLGNPIAYDIFPVQLTNNAPANGFPVGSTLVTWQAIDANGNMTSVQQTIAVNYQFGGFLQPIDSDGSSLFKLGSTVPVKFKLTDAFGNSVPDAIANIYIAKVTDQVMGSVTEGLSTSAATSGNLFRYDSTEQQYIFNLNTKPLSKGTFIITVNLNDGTTYSVNISLK